MYIKIVQVQSLKNVCFILITIPEKICVFFMTQKIMIT